MNVKPTGTAALVLVAIAANSAEARRYVPLMPTRGTAAKAVVARRASSTKVSQPYRLPELGAGPNTFVAYESQPSTASSSSAAPTATAGQALGFGVELGALSTPTSGAAGFSPMFAPGGRAYLRIPMWDRVYFKPSLGYFFQSDGTVAIPVTRHVFELGGTLQYSLLHGGGFRLLAGLAARVDLALVQENDAFGQPVSSFDTSVRGGPALGMLYGLTQFTSLSLDLDGTYSTSGRFLFGAAAGVVFYLR